MTVSTTSNRELARGPTSLDYLDNDDIDCIESELRRQGINFEGKHLPISRQIYVVHAEQDKAVCVLFRGLHTVIEKVLVAYQTNASIHKFLRLPEHMHRLVMSESSTGSEHLNFFCRYDFTFDEQGNPQVYEVNADCPATIFFSRHVYTGLTQAPKFREISASGHRAAFDHQVSSPFVQAFMKRVGKKQAVIAILNSRHHTLWNEVELIVKDFQRNGQQAFHAYVEDLEYDGQNLCHQGQKIDACYCKFDNVHEFDEVSFSQSAAEVGPFLRAVKESKVIMFNHFHGMYLAEHKGLLALLHDPKFSFLFSKEDRELIATVVPESHMLTTDNLRKFALEKDSWIIKGCLDTRGRSVSIGANMSPTNWRKALEEAAVSAEQVFIAQRYCPHEHIHDRYISHSYFLVDAEPSGWMTRVSKHAITNIAYGGGMQIPILVGTVH